MALLKTGIRYPLAIVSSFSYVCSNETCKYAKTLVESSKEVCDICPTCGYDMSLVSSHTETKTNRR